MDKISFQSRIRPVSIKEFNRVTQTYGKKNFVDYPWTVKESVVAKNAYTKEVYDCTVCGITDGLKVLLLHICPTMFKNEKFSNIEKFIKSKIDLNNPNLQGFILGSKKMPTLENYSERLFENFSKLLKSYKIPTTELRGGLDTHNVAYSSQTDEWLIAQVLLKDKELQQVGSARGYLENIFDDVKISNMDEVSW